MSIVSIIEILLFFCALILSVFNFLFIKREYSKYRPKPKVEENEYELMGEIIPEFPTVSNSNENFKLRDIIKDNFILIFIDSGCARCNSNISIFLQIVKYTRDIDYAFVIPDTQVDKIKEYEDLYDNPKIFILSENEISFFSIQAYPFYVFIDKNKVIQYATSIPYWIIERVKSKAS